MNIKERLFAIPDLILSKQLPMMSNAQLENYTALLHSFTEDFPAHEEKIQAAMDTGDVKSLIGHLTSLREILINIHADGLADECRKRLSNFDKDKPERIESYVSFFLSNLATLSIDIQMAFFNEEDKENLPEPGSGFIKEANAIKTILAVDDDAYCLDTFKAALKDIPCKIIGVTSGLGALDVLKTIKPDLFVLDIEMPSMDGIDLARRIRTLEQYAPIIFITGKATKLYVRKCMQVGASDFIVKPINPQNAVNRIQKFL